jgi:hypothetical protein
MKKYTTWEAIKMLSENPKLKLNLIYCGNETADKNLEVKDNMIILNAKNPFNRYLNISAEWVLVQQPVSFMEAVKAYSRGKTIYCVNVDVGLKNIYKKPDSTNSYMKDTCHYCITSHEILNYEWFIEEGEQYDR